MEYSVYWSRITYTAPPSLKQAFIERISNLVKCCFEANSTFDLSDFVVNMGKLWKKTEITSENQNNAGIKQIVIQK